MKKERTTILYLFIFLIILAGLSLIIFKDNLTNQFLRYSNDSGELTVSSGSSDLKLDILRDSRIKALKNYVSIFNYDDLNKSQDAIAAAHNSKSDVVISNPGETGTSTESATSGTGNYLRVRVGNSNPFIVNKIVR